MGVRLFPFMPEMGLSFCLFFFPRHRKRERKKKAWYNDSGHAACTLTGVAFCLFALLLISFFLPIIPLCLSMLDRCHVLK
ncbi:hypothetical protein EDD21DRAFT_392274 [Dissophora ornata]|nr:hypothetical protein EDD21DRAFT_392274 [Dissophora ornata]